MAPDTAAIRLYIRYTLEQLEKKQKNLIDSGLPLDAKMRTKLMDLNWAIIFNLQDRKEHHD